MTFCSKQTDVLPALLAMGEKIGAMHTIIFFVPTENSQMRRVMEEAALRLPHDIMTTCRTAEELVECILTTSSEAYTVVLALLSDRDLSVVLSLKGLLKSVRTLLILPDDSNETLRRILPLQPCYQTSLTGNLHEVTAVLEKISEYQRRSVGGAGAGPRGRVFRENGT